jgi:hypothetical protein
MIHLQRNNYHEIKFLAYEPNGGVPEPPLPPLPDIPDNPPPDEVPPELPPEPPEDPVGTFLIFRLSNPAAKPPVEPGGGAFGSVVALLKTSLISSSALVTTSVYLLPHGTYLPRRARSVPVISVIIPESVILFREA